MKDAAATEPDDRALALAAIADHAAFDALYQRYVARVYRYIFVRVHDPAEADDLTSQTFLAALLAIGEYQGRGAFPAWLFGIACRKVADHYRGQQHLASLDDAEDLLHPMPALDALVHGRLQLQRVLRAMRRLTPERAEAVRLRVFGELSCAEVAEIMGRNVPAVKMLVHRGMGDLRGLLNAEGAEGAAR
jgi:RNA polymerase sigma-70 factor (ECF subfamily)